MEIVYHYIPETEVAIYKNYLITNFRNDSFIKILIALISIVLVLYLIAFFFFDNEEAILLESIFIGILVTMVSYLFVKLFDFFYCYYKTKSSKSRFQNFVFDIHFLEDKFLIKIKNLPDDIVYYNKIKKIERFENSIIIELKESLQYNVISMNNFYINLNKNAFVGGDFYELINFLKQKHKVTY